MRSRAEFTAAVRGGRRAGTPLLLAHLRADTAGPTRVGFVIGRPVGTAVRRNLLRRRLRHLVRERLDRLPAGSALVIRVNPPAASATSAQLAAALDRSLAKLLDAPGADR
jgi:ribonuclease P protein component